MDDGFIVLDRTAGGRRVYATECTPRHEEIAGRPRASAVQRPYFDVGTSGGRRRKRKAKQRRCERGAYSNLYRHGVLPFHRLA